MEPRNYFRVPWESPQTVPTTPMSPPGRRIAALTFGGPGGIDMPPLPPGVNLTFEPHRYAFPLETVWPIGIVSTLVCSEPVGVRNMLMLRNASTGGQNVFVSFGIAASINSILILLPNTMIIHDTCVPQQEVNAVASAAGALLTVSFSNMMPPF
ncbi:MAG TPA: hypothetical protein VJ521_04250 [Acidobacteriota bacterium]|nr:hypothetical protein [Acidobacteriota bacterium]